MIRICLGAQHDLHTCLLHALEGELRVTSRHTVEYVRGIVRLMLVRASAGWHTPACAAAVMEIRIKYSNFYFNKTKKPTALPSSVSGSFYTLGVLPRTPEPFLVTGSCSGPRRSSL